MKYPTQLFLINAETWGTLYCTDIEDTVRAMKNMNIYRLPYPEVSVRIQTQDKHHQIHFDHLSLEHDNLIVTPVCYDHKCHAKRIVFTLNRYNMDEGPIGTDKIKEIVANALIVLLATRNAIKTTVEHKAAKFGIGSKNKRSTKRFQYVTTISVPHESDLEDTPDAAAKPTGIKKYAHLRRGHVRNQRYGPKYSFIRQIFIEPIFVNADPDWVNGRERYNVSL